MNRFDWQQFAGLVVGLAATAVIVYGLLTGCGVVLVDGRSWFASIALAVIVVIALVVLLGEVRLPETAEEEGDDADRAGRRP